MNRSFDPDDERKYRYDGDIDEYVTDSYYNDENNASDDSVDDLNSKLYQLHRGSWGSMSQKSSTGKEKSDNDKSGEDPWEKPLSGIDFIEEEEKRDAVKKT